MRGIYEAWKLPGCEEVVEPISATDAKPIGAMIIIASASRKFRIWWNENAIAYDRGGWRLEERWVLGRDGRGADWQYVDEFRTLREAKVTARRLALGGQK